MYSVFIYSCAARPAEARAAAGSTVEKSFIADDRRPVWYSCTRKQESLNELAQFAGKSTELSATEISRDQSKSDESEHACTKILRKCYDLPVCNDTGSNQVSEGASR